MDAVRLLWQATADEPANQPTKEQPSMRPTNSTVIPATEQPALYRVTVTTYNPSTGERRTVFSVTERTGNPDALCERAEALREPLARFYGASIAHTSVTVAPVYCAPDSPGYAANN